jgi:hypothetical protein
MQDVKNITLYFIMKEINGKRYYVATRPSFDNLAKLHAYCKRNNITGYTVKERQENVVYDKFGNYSIA